MLGSIFHANNHSKITPTHESMAPTIVFHGHAFNITVEPGAIPIKKI
jgi:hypothetical protein